MAHILQGIAYYLVACLSIPILAMVIFWPIAVAYSRGWNAGAMLGFQMGYIVILGSIVCGVIEAKRK